MSKKIIARNPIKDRSGVQRRHAPTYVLILLLSFAFSVTATRIFLNLTGFPQIGGGELHIAHVLWGGLFLFVASLIPLIFANQWALELSALISGVGVGLFIDEVGKFITRSNDYFYPSAAPIIYTVFLLTVLVFVQVKHQRKPSHRAEMYAILEDFTEVLDRDLSEFEFKQLNARLAGVLEGCEDDQLRGLAVSLQTYLQQQSQFAPHDPTLVERIQATFQRFESHWLKRKNLRLAVILGLILWAIWAMASQTVMFLSTHNAQQFQLMVEQFTQNRLIRNASGMNWFEIQILLEGTMGLIALASVICFLTHHDNTATWLGIFDLLVTLTAVNLLTFYFDQFSTIAFAVYQFILLVLLLQYRRHYVTPKKVKRH
jgi:hypothetical protein